MLFFKKKKRDKSFEKKFEEFNTTVLTDKDIKNTGKLEQYVVEHLEQMIEISKEMEEGKTEYRLVTSYLSDIQILEKLPEEDRRNIEEVAVNVVQLNAARTEFLNSAKKLSDAQFTQLEQEEKNIPAAAKRLSSNEIYQDTLQRDLKYLDREKSEWMLHKEYLGHQQKGLKNLLYIMIGIAATVAVLFGILQFALEMDLYYAWMILVFVTAVSICAIFLKIQNNSTEITAAERNANRAIVLSNKVKIKYVNIKNAIDYACEKYHVRDSAQLNQYWGYYLEAVKEKEKYERTNDDLEYFNGRLVRMLKNYQLYDSQIWIGQAVALTNPKEMVEIKHDLVNRRQKLREKIDYNTSILKQLRIETEQVMDRVGEVKPQIQEIINAIEKLSES